MAARAPQIPLANETKHSVSRITREGKKLTYKLSVMQQPERARACGAGAKSSADRRPVDPPPVVELRVFESDPADDLQETDITFAYNANFFLYATLENARPIAPGKAASPITCPVLTGVPVAGVAYLDRPAQAGYFIFPDLSVRHEGRYRLSFHLYEEIKDPKDIDKDSPLANQTSILRPPASGKPGEPQAYLHFRLEVKSVPFTVYSAKKFPGLATSTSLSRIIAEQGCRVRIRRDVRMRRRGEKQGEDYEYDEERERVFARSPRYTTPDGYVTAAPVDRPRSTSITTSILEPSLAYAPEAQRRPSAAREYGIPPPPAQPQPLQKPAVPAPPAPAPPQPSNPSSYHSHLAFGGPLVPYQTPLLPSASHATAPSVPFSPQSSNVHVRHPSSSSDYETANSGSQYGPPRSQTDPSEYSNTALPPLRLESLPPKPSSAGQPFGEHRPSDTNPYIVPRAQTPTIGTAAPSLPSLKIISGEYANGNPLASLSAPGAIPHNSAPPPPLPSAPLAGRKSLYETGAALAKRSHEDSFGLDERPMQNGMRPDAEPCPPALQKQLEPSSRYFYLEPRGEMEYKRANGRMAMKVPPTLQ